MNITKQRLGQFVRQVKGISRIKPVIGSGSDVLADIFIAEMPNMIDASNTEKVLSEESEEVSEYGPSCKCYEFS